MCQNWIETKRANAPKPDPFTHKKSNIMLHLFQQTSRYNKSVVQTRYKKERKTLIRIRKLNTLEPKPGTYNTDINYLRCLELKQTKLNLTQEIQIIYYTIPVNFFCSHNFVRFCPFKRITEHRKALAMQNIGQLGCVGFVISSTFHPLVKGRIVWTAINTTACCSFQKWALSNIRSVRSLKCQQAL